MKNVLVAKLEISRSFLYLFLINYTLYAILDLCQIALTSFSYIRLSYRKQEQLPRTY